MSYDLLQYYQPAGRDFVIDKYRNSRAAVLKKVESKRFSQKNLKLDELERVLNAIFYPKLISTNLDSFYNTIIGSAEQAISSGTKAVMSQGFDSIPAYMGAGKTFSLIQQKQGLESFKAGSFKRMQSIMEDIGKAAIRAVTREGKTDLINEVTKLRDNFIKTANDIWNEYIQAYATMYGMAPTDNSYMYRKRADFTTLIGKSGSIDKQIEELFIVYADFAKRFGIAEPVDRLSIGTFFEEAIRTFFDEGAKNVINKTATGIENDVVKSVKKATRTGGTQVKMATGRNMAYKVSISTDDIEKARLISRVDTDTGKSKVSRTFNDPVIGDFEICAETIQNYDYAGAKQQKTDVEVIFKNRQRMGISAKNWSDFYSLQYPNKDQYNGTISYQILSGIAQTFNNGDYVKYFLGLIQDNVNAPNRSGNYTGYDAYLTAQEMAIFGTLIAGFMGINQDKNGYANVFFLNIRTEKRIYVIDLGEIVIDYANKIITSNGLDTELNYRNMIKIGLLENPIDELNRKAHAIMRSGVTGMHVKEVFLYGLMHNQKMSYAFMKK